MITSKRFASTADQLRQLRDLLDQYVRAHWRKQHAAEIDARRIAGDKLLAAQPPEVRMDTEMARLFAIVDRVMAPALPDALVRLDGHHGA